MTAPGSAGPPSPYPALPGHDQPATPYSAHPGPDGPAPHGPAPDGPAPHGTPPPPPGPGVSPPFAAPPTEGRTMRMWIGLGVAGLAVVLCCGGGAAALVGLAVTENQAASEQARAVAGEYFAAVKDKQYGKAYDLLCDSDQSRESPAEFERRVAAQPEISAYQVGEPSRAGPVTVPVDVTYSGGSQDLQRITLAQDSGTGRLEVCGIR